MRFILAIASRISPILFESQVFIIITIIVFKYRKYHLKETKNIINV